MWLGICTGGLWVIEQMFFWGLDLGVKRPKYVTTLVAQRSAGELRSSVLAGTLWLDSSIRVNRTLIRWESATLKKRAQQLWALIIGLEVIAAAINHIFEDYHHINAILSRFF